MNYTYPGSMSFGPEVDLSADSTDPWSTLDVHDPYWNSTSDESWLSAAIQAENTIPGNTGSSLHMEELPIYSHCTFCQQVDCCCATFDQLFAPTQFGGTGSTTGIPTAACTPRHDERPLGSPRDTDKPTNSVSVVKMGPRRTKISSLAKTILEQFFSFNPYPDRSDLHTLRSATKVKESAIRTWFSNSRSRKSGRCSSCHRLLDV